MVRNLSIYVDTTNVATVKAPARRKLSMARLELLMRLSLSYRKQGADLAKQFDILRDAAVIFDDALLQGASDKNTGKNEQDISFLDAFFFFFHPPADGEK